MNYLPGFSWCDGFDLFLPVGFWWGFNGELHVLVAMILPYQPTKPFVVRSVRIQVRLPSEERREMTQNKPTGVVHRQDSGRNKNQTIFRHTQSRWLNIGYILPYIMGKYGKYGKIWECIHLVSHNCPIRYKYIPLVLLAKLCYPSQIHVRLGVRDTGIDVVRDKHAKWPSYIDGIICIVYIYIHVYIPKMI